ncbi:RDD family protein [Streptomyces sp. YGL11-2]|uniref:RDD family protein n=1 Tax=Streptomyces sp. YGL11-2 TaxID=3414028 RepID=UPI003CEB7152
MSGQDFPPQQPYPQYNQQPPQQPYPQYNQQPPQPYQQQPYQQAPPPNGQYGYQSTSQQPPAQYQYQPTPPQAPAPSLPAAVSEARRFLTSVIDGLLSAAVGYLGFVVAHNPRQGVITGLGAAFGFAFINHVLLTRVSGASLGKFITQTRVILSSDGGRPRLPRLFRRWLAGYLFVVIAYIADWFRKINIGHKDPYWWPDLPKDFCGIRLVRSDDS